MRAGILSENKRYMNVKRKLRLIIILLLLSLIGVLSPLYLEKYQGQNELLLSKAQARKKVAVNGLINGAHCEVRGVWVDELTSSNQMAQLLHNIQRANMNTVFVVSPPINKYNGWSSKKNFKRFVKEAHKRRLNVHIWMPNMYRGKSGQRADFRTVKERKEQRRWASKLLKKYKKYVGGIHYDYIRYYDWEDVNTGGKMDAVDQALLYMTGMVKRRYRDKFATATTLSASPNWADFGNEDIPQWFRVWYGSNPGNIYEATYSYDTVPVHMKFQQNPVLWLSSGLADAVMPMQYTVDDTTWYQEVDSWQSFLNFVGKEPTRICMGIGWLEEEGHPDWGYNPEGVVNKIKYGRAKGLKGFVIYELNGGSRDEELVNVLTVDSSLNGNDAPYKNEIGTCFMEQ